eukprot:jgi/Orpsp1_1/1187167/evm.model.d7180000055899.1
MSSTFYIPWKKPRRCYVSLHGHDWLRVRFVVFGTPEHIKMKNMVNTYILNAPTEDINQFHQE